MGCVNSEENRPGLSDGLFQWSRSQQNTSCLRRFGSGHEINRFEFIENVPCSSLTEHCICGSAVVFRPNPPSPLKQHYGVYTMPFQCISRLRADACSGCFVLSILCGFVLNSNSNFKSAPLSTSGSELPQLHLGTSKPTLVYHGSCIYSVIIKFNLSSLSRARTTRKFYLDFLCCKPHALGPNS